MILIGIGGKAQAGKSTVATYLQSEHNFNPASFARRLKKATQVKFNLTDEECSESNKNKNEKIERWGLSFREMLQIEGTEAGWQMYDPRISKGPSLWVRHIDFLWKALNNPDNFDLGYKGLVISDMRFPHEYAWVKSCGGVAWKVVRPGVRSAVGIKGHASEAWEFEPDVEINNDKTILDLYSRVETEFQKLLRAPAGPHVD